MIDGDGPLISGAGKLLQEKIQEAEIKEEKKRWFEVMTGKRSFNVGKRKYKLVSR